MITRITKQNRAKYDELFASATRVLQLAEDESISSLEDYFSYLYELKDVNPKFVRLPADEDYFLIDLNSRKITIPTSFKTVGLGVQGDKFAEVIYFKADRYFDTTDLNNTQIYIMWENAQGQKYFDSAYLPDVTTETDKIIFGWGIGEEITRTPGNIKFSVVFIDGRLIAAENVLIDIESLDYRLSTLPTTISVNTGLNFDLNIGVGLIDSTAELHSRIKSVKPIGDVIPAPVPVMYSYNGYDWSKSETYELSDLIDNVSTASVETALTALAYPSEGAGIISYEWFKGEKEDPTPMLGGYSYLKYIGAKQEGRTYYTLEGQAEYRIVSSSDDWDALSADGKIFERVGFCEVNEPGKYFVKVTNKAGRSFSELTPNGEVIIPGPTALSEVSITVKNGDEIFVDGEELVLVANVVGADDKDTLHYLWSDGSEEAELKIKSAGVYSVEVWSSRNGGTTLTDKVNATINIYAAAINPVNVELTASEYVAAGSNIALLTDEKNLVLSVKCDPVEVGEIKFEWYDEDGALVGSTDTYQPQDTGVYRVVVTHFISAGNSASVEKEITVAKI